MLVYNQIQTNTFCQLLFLYDVDWMYLARDSNCRLALVNTVMYLRVP
jgi:hypothetical protein